MANPFGFTTPFSGFVDPRRNQLMGMAAGLAGGGLGGMWQGGMQGSGLDMRAQEQQFEQDQRNQTAEWLKANYPQYAGLPPAEGFRAAMAEMGRAQGGADQERFFGNVIPMEDEQGNIIFGQASNQGRWQPLQGAEGFTPAPTTKQIDAGNMVITTDIYGNELYRTPKSGSVPTGFQPSPAGGGAVAPMPGSPQAMEVSEAQAKAVSALNTLEQKNAIALNAVDKALQSANFGTTGFIGGMSNAIPGTPAYDLARTLDTIKANIGFEELQAMRDNSPTGGALGQVTERELAFLQSTITNIEQAQSEQQLRENLTILRDFLASSAERRRMALEQQYGGMGGGQAPAQPGTGTTSTGLPWSIEP